MRRARYYYVYLAISLTYNRLPINWGVGTATPVNARIGAQNSVDASHPHKTRGFLIDIAGEASGLSARSRLGRALRHWFRFSEFR